jgi:hypothetical protein
MRQCRILTAFIAAIFISACTRVSLSDVRGTAWEGSYRQTGVSLVFVTDDLLRSITVTPDRRLHSREWNFSLESNRILLKSQGKRTGYLTYEQDRIVCSPKDIALNQDTAEIIQFRRAPSTK